MAQTHDLMNRNIDTPPYSQPGALNELTPQHTISSTPNAMQSLGMDRQWPSLAVKGFSDLVYAVLYQPAVDMDRLSPSIVQHLLAEAAAGKVFSYIRIAMLPVLRSNIDLDSTSFLLSALTELLNNVITILCLAVYPRLPIPIDKQQQSEDETWARRHLVYQSLSAASASAPEQSDSLTDLLELLTDICIAHPPFVENVLWHNGSYHPFLSRASDLCKDPVILTKFLAAAGHTVGIHSSAIAYSMYTFVERKFAGRRDWQFFFRYIEDITMQLNSHIMTSSDTMTPMGMMTATTTAGIHTTISASGASVGRMKKLSPQDTEALIAFHRLLETVFKSSQAIQCLRSLYRTPDSIIVRMFHLLACPVPSPVKGAIFQSLASLVQTDETAAEEIWILIEEHRLLPTTQFGGTVTTGIRAGVGAGGRHTLSDRGLHYELEVVESAVGCYPATNGFLSLLNALLLCGVPEELGTGYRRPGVLIYLEYVLHEILFKLYLRPYHPGGAAGAAQRWRLAARVMRILVTVLQGYDVNDVQSSPQGIHNSASSQKLAMCAADFTEIVESYVMSEGGTSQRWPRPKTAGFVLMTWLLGRSRLLDCVLHLLKDGYEENGIQNIVQLQVTLIDM